MKESLKPNYVVEGRIRGRDYPDQWILAGNHRDAWVFGGSDPSSGTASMMEMTRGLGHLLKKGIRPRRTHHVPQLGRRRDQFRRLRGMERAIRPGATGKKPWPTLTSTWRRRAPIFRARAPAPWRRYWSKPASPCSTLRARASTTRGGSTASKQLQEADDGETLTDFNLAETRVGSGSDYAALLDHAGVPIIDLTFDGPYGVYHSAYDNFYWMNHFGDPGYRYQTLMAQLWGVLVLRLANADLLPFDFSSYGAHVRHYLDTLATQHSLNLLDLGPLRTSIDSFERAGQALEVTKGVALQSGRLDPMLADQLNRGVMGWSATFSRRTVSPTDLGTSILFMPAARPTRTWNCRG